MASLTRGRVRVALLAGVIVGLALLARRRTIVVRNATAGDLLIDLEISGIRASAPIPARERRSVDLHGWATGDSSLLVSVDEQRLALCGYEDLSLPPHDYVVIVLRGDDGILHVHCEQLPIW